MTGRILILSFLLCSKMCSSLSPINEVKSKNTLCYSKAVYTEDCSYDETDDKDEQYSFLVTLKYEFTLNIAKPSNINYYQQYIKETNEIYKKRGNEIYHNLNLRDYSDIYISSCSPFLVYKYDSKEMFESHDIMTLECQTDIKFDNIYLEEYIPNTTIIDDDSNSKKTNNYSFSDALIDVGIPNNKTYQGNGIRIGSIETGIPNNNSLISNNIKGTFGTHRTLHCTKTSSIYSGDDGIANKAELYFASSYNYKFIEGIDYLIEQNVEIINCSMSTPNDSNVDYAKTIINTYNIAFVVSNGNATSTERKISKLSSVPNAISVAASNSAKDVSSLNSNHFLNSTKTECKPTLLAPGENIIGKKYFDSASSGTSYSVPFVTGIIALLMEEFTDLKRNPTKVIALLSNSCTKAVNQKNFFEQYSSGFGIVNYSNAKTIYKNTYSAIIDASTNVYNKNIKLDFGQTIDVVSIISIDDSIPFKIEDNTSDSIGNISFIQYTNLTHLTNEPTQYFNLKYLTKNLIQQSANTGASYSLSYFIHPSVIYNEVPEGLKFNIAKTIITGFDTPTDFNGILYIPDCVKVIEEYAFSGNKDIKAIIFSENSNLSEIKRYAFYSCTNLETIIIPNLIDNIASFAFLGDINLTCYFNFDTDYIDWENLWNLKYVDYDSMIEDHENGIIKDDTCYYKYVEVRKL